MTLQQIQQVNEKFLELLRNLTSEQSEWIRSLPWRQIDRTNPEEFVFEAVVDALRVGIRSSTARILIADQLTVRDIPFSLQKINQRSYAAKQYYESLGNQPQLPIPPMVIPAVPNKEPDNSGSPDR